MSTVMQFENPEFGKIRVIKINGEVWFVANEVCTVLGYQNARKAVADHVEDEDKRVLTRDEILTVTNRYGQKTRGGAQFLTVINESGFYSLVLSSQLPRAKEFKRWVTSEVLPSIRKTGSYIVPTTTNRDPKIIIQALQEACKLSMRLHRDLGIDRKMSRTVSLQLTSEAFNVDLSILQMINSHNLDFSRDFDIDLLPF